MQRESGGVVIRSSHGIRGGVDAEAIRRIRLVGHNNVCIMLPDTSITEIGADLALGLMYNNTDSLTTVVNEFEFENWFDTAIFTIGVRAVTDPVDLSLIAHGCQCRKAG